VQDPSTPPTTERTDPSGRTVPSGREERTARTERTVRGVPLRHILMATAIALVVAVTAGALVLLSADPADTPTTGATMDLESPRDVVGSPAAVGYLTFEGTPANTGAYVGQPLVLNFFAEWCAPCVAEMPDFERVHQEVAGEVAFLGLSLLEPEDNALALIERTGITYDVGRDTDGEAYEFFAGFAMPTTVFIDSAGTVVEVHSGALTADQLRDRIDTLLR
jgi:cytochrome c biogenesis protein CcmG, thiol:disulfide interchange protein DsbE